MILATTTVEDFDRFMKVFSTKGVESASSTAARAAPFSAIQSQADRVWARFRLGRQGLAELRRPIPRSRRS